MLNGNRLEYYLNLKTSQGNNDLMSRRARNIRVLNIRKLSGGMTNNVYSFVLSFTEGESEQSINLILKGYSELTNLWFKTIHQGEEVRRYLREYDTLEALQIVGFPVSKVYFFEVDPFFLGYPFLIMRKETVIQESFDNISSFAVTLATLHNLDVGKLRIKSLCLPKNNSEFASMRLDCLKRYVNENKHYRFLKKDFDYAIDWLESKVADNYCPKYCLIHGEYHPGHTLLSKDNRLIVIDWESVAIGDPAFDVGYAYHMVKLMSNEKAPNSGDLAAEYFVSEYSRNYHGDVHRRLEFYKVVTILGVAIVVSSWISNPMEAYRLFGRNAFVRALVFPLLHSNSLGKRWLNEDFLVSSLQYCQDFIQTNLR